MDKKKCGWVYGWFQIVYRIVTYVKTKQRLAWNKNAYYIMYVKRVDLLIKRLADQFLLPQKYLEKNYILKCQIYAKVNKCQYFLY